MNAAGTAPRAPSGIFTCVLGTITVVAPMTTHLFLPAMPQVKVDFGLTDATVQIAFSLSLLCMALCTPVYGTVSDRFGRRPALLTGLVLFTIGSVVSAIAPTFAMLVIGRIAQAAGSSAVFTLTRAIARDAYSSSGVVKALAYLTMAFTLGPTIAPVVGGALIDHVGWRSVFWLAALISITITIATYLVIYETRSSADRATVPGSVFHIFTGLLRNPRFIAFTLVVAASTFSFFAILAASPFLMLEVLARPATEYGLNFLIIPIGYAAGNYIAAQLGGKVRGEKMILIGTLIGVGAIAVQAGYMLGGYLSPALIFVPAGIMSVGQGLALPNAQAGAMSVRPAVAGTAAGLATCIQLGLAASAIQLYGLLADGTPTPMVWLAVGGAVVTLSSGLFLYRHPRPTPP